MMDARGNTAERDARPLCELAGVVNKELDEALAMMGNLESRLIGPRPAVGMGGDRSDGSLQSAFTEAAAKAGRLSTWARDLLRQVEGDNLANVEPQKRYG
jgi:hypothetical protein